MPLSSSTVRPSFCIKHLLMCIYLDARTRAAIHAPTSENWAENIDYPFGNSKRVIGYTNSVFIYQSIGYSSGYSFGDPSRFRSPSFGPDVIEPILFRSPVSTVIHSRLCILKRG